MVDFLLFILLFFSVLSVLYLLKRDESTDKETKNVSNEQDASEDNNSEFKNDDFDREVDEMPDDCLIYDDLFDEE